MIVLIWDHCPGCGRGSDLELNTVTCEIICKCGWEGKISERECTDVLIDWDIED